MNLIPVVPADKSSEIVPLQTDSNSGHKGENEMTLKEAETLYPRQFAKWKERILRWLDEKEKQWNLDKPVSRKAFIFDSLRQVDSFPED